MKILHISSLPLWSMDGKGGMPSLQETLKGHVKAGFEIEIILPEYDLFSNELKPLTVKNNEKFKIHTAQCPWLPLIKKIRQKIIRIHGNEIPYIYRWIINILVLKLYTLSLVLKALKIRKKFKPDLVYAHNQYSAAAGFLIGRLWKIPNVTRLYGTFLADLMKKPFVSLRYPTAAAGYLMPCSLLICANDGTRGDKVAQKFRIDPKRFCFWQNGIKPPEKVPDTDRSDFVEKYRDKLRKESIWIISCSRLSSWKRIDRIFYAMKFCLDKKIDCQLILAGDGPEKKSLEKLACDLNISENIIWSGSVEHEKIWALMNCADIFMITNDVTNRCNPLFESVWAGLPVVSVKDPSSSDILLNGINSFLCDKDNVHELGSKLAQLCLDSSLRSEFRKEQKKMAHGFKTWEERMEIESKELEKVILKSRKFKNRNN